MTHDEVEKIIKQNMNLQMNLAGIRADFEEALQRPWVGLTDEDWDYLNKSCGSIRSAVKTAEALLKEKNT